MPIDLDDIADFGDELNPAPQIGPIYGLVVSARAAPASAERDELLEESHLFLRQAKLTPFVLFYEESADAPDEETFTNGAEWARFMGLDYVPSEEECLAWERERLRTIQ